MNKNSFLNRSGSGSVGHYRMKRGLAFGIIIVGALIAFEAFNYSTTDFALNDLLGELSFFGIPWATILALAFCGIDFAGIARLFTPEEGQNERNDAWYLFGAWLLAATMNAMLTWWGVSIAIMNHETLGSTFVERTTLLRVVPIFVAVLVWLIRVLIIGAFSIAGDRLFSQSNLRQVSARRNRSVGTTSQPVHTLGSPSFKPKASASEAAINNAFRPAPKPISSTDTSYTPPEPVYTPLQMSGINESNPVGTGSTKVTSRPFSSRTTYES